MSREWQPGDVAMSAYGRVFRVPGGWVFDDHEPAATGSPRDLRPLVVIDPEDREQVERLTWALQQESTNEREIDDMQDALRSLTRPPKPAEPLVLGARVRDRDGEMWVRNAQAAWINLHGRYGLDPARTWDGLCEKYGPIEVTP